VSPLARGAPPGSVPLGHCAIFRVSTCTGKSKGVLPQQYVLLDSHVFAACRCCHVGSERDRGESSDAEVKRAHHAEVKLELFWFWHNVRLAPPIKSAVKPRPSDVFVDFGLLLPILIYYDRKYYFIIKKFRRKIIHQG